MDLNKSTIDIKRKSSSNNGQTNDDASSFSPAPPPRFAECVHRSRMSIRNGSRDDSQLRRDRCRGSCRSDQRKSARVLYDGRTIYGMRQNENTRMLWRRSKTKKKTKTTKRIGFQFVRGSLSELIDLSQKCCVNKGEKIGDECPFVSE